MQEESSLTLTIGQLATASGVNLETVRYYERLGFRRYTPFYEGRGILQQ